MMQITGQSAEGMIRALAAAHKVAFGEDVDFNALLVQAENIVPRSKRAIEPCQAAALYLLVHNYARDVNATPNILEIGTAQGYSATIMKLAAPGATITTLNPHDTEPAIARPSVF